MNCEGCSQNFYKKCLDIHIEQLHQDLNTVTNDCDQFRRILLEQQDNPNSQVLIQEINQWEKNAIRVIEQTAGKCRQRLINHQRKSLINMEKKLNDIVEQIGRIREEAEFTKIDLDQFREKLQ